MKNRLIIFNFLVISSLLLRSAKAEGGGVDWQSFSDDVFKRATAEHKLVLLDVEAIWCHWCHVMDKETYSNPEIQNILSKNFIAIKVDQDSRPDISTRYQDYGWPATIVLSSDGTDLVKKAGYLPFEEMKEMLVDVVAHPVVHSDESASSPSSGPVLNAPGALSQEIKAKLISLHEYFFDFDKGGLDFAQRYLDPFSIELVLREAQSNTPKYEEFAKRTLTANLKLIDPVWGGVYQYSTDRDWDHPHFEKIGAPQANNIRAYSYAFALWHSPEYLNAAQKIREFLKTFLRSPDGAFYTSQDADLIKGQHSGEYFSLPDAERRAKGIPAVDKHSYSYENGIIITALSQLYSATGDETVLQDAILAAKWMQSNRKTENGAFKHDEKDVEAKFLRDNVAMGQGLLSIYMATGERDYLKNSEQVGQYIIKNFQTSWQPGYYSFSPSSAGILKPSRLQEENVDAARFLNLLGYFTGNDAYHKSAQVAMNWLSIPAVATQYKIGAGILMTDQELQNPPLHITIVGHKDDPAAIQLFKAGIAYPGTYKRVEWWDKREGAMPNPDVEYPELDKAAAFVCTGRRCSLPVFAPDGIAKLIEKFNKTKK